jgi:hypothetical protein
MPTSSLPNPDTSDKRMAVGKISCWFSKWWKTMIPLALIAAISFSPAGAHNTTVNHLWKAHIKPKLARAGTINKKNNPVNWTRLKNVPAGIADGDDDMGAGGGGGDITAVLTGGGIVGGGTSGDVGVAADPNVLQQRITGVCPPGQAIRSVDVSGTVTCEIDDSPTARAGFKDGPGPVPSNMDTIGKLDLPAGRYVILAKMYLNFPAEPGAQSAVECHLTTGADFDVSRASGEFTKPSQHTLSFMVVHDFNAPGNARVTCLDFNGGVQYRFLKIIAMPVATFVNGGL